MLLSATTVFATLFLARQLVEATSYKSCSAGEYIDGSMQCQPCADGHYNTFGDFSNKPTTCAACPSGSQSNSGHTLCTPCPDGSYSTGGSQCQKCPAGQTNNILRNGCTKCDAGEFNPSAGGTCSDCSSGSFNSVSGAKSCCQCCAGWYATFNLFGGSKSCTKCPSDFPYSAVGSNSIFDCKDLNHKGTRPSPVGSCTMLADNSCPNPSGNGPAGSPIARKKRDVHCAQGFDACPRYSGRGGFDCVDTENDPESCGGCIGLDGHGTGKDCTAIKGVSATRCVKRSCVIDSCRKGWVKSLDGNSCVLASHHTEPTDRSGLNIQDTRVKQKRSSAKRAIRGSVY